MNELNVGYEDMPLLEASLTLGDFYVEMLDLKPWNAMIESRSEGLCISHLPCKILLD